MTCGRSQLLESGDAVCESSCFAAPSLAPGAPVATRTSSSLFTISVYLELHSLTSLHRPAPCRYTVGTTCNDEHERSHQRARLLAASPAGFRRYCCASSCQTQNQNECVVPGPPTLAWQTGCPIFDVLARGPVFGASRSPQSASESDRAITVPRENKV